MNRRIAPWIVFAALLVALTIGCSTRATVDAQINSLKAQLAELREQGAPICAPREYAAAEAHLDFAREEWGEREYIAAQDHIGAVKKSMEAAKRWLENCVEKVPPDADGDGVLDPDDACPNEPGPKENKGCPWPDSDKDGVPDNVDKCPHDPGPKEAEGCPDSDKDGLADNVDKCPKEWGPKDNNGCPKNVKITGDAVEILQKIQFDTNKSDIKPESFPILDEVVAVLKSFPTWRIEVQGHTDSQGGRPKNMKLSQARAESCRQYLIQHGIDAGRLTANGYGPDRPIASNNTPVGREKNRRTEFKIVSK